MSQKNRDEKARWRNRQVAFRLSPEEADLLDTHVRLSGQTKQDYITSRLLNRQVVVQGNPRVFKALHGQFGEVVEELRRIENASVISDELLDTICMMTTIMDGLRKEESLGK